MRTTTRALLIPAALLLLAGCASTVTLTPADDATNPACADVIVHLPDTVAGLASRETDAQATAAWGTPASVILHCGVPVPPPTAEFRCLTYDGVDWLIDDTGDPVVVATTYGRDPAVEVVMQGAEGGVVLTDLSSAVAGIPAERACIAIGDTN